MKPSTYSSPLRKKNKRPAVVSPHHSSLTVLDDLSVDSNVIEDEFNADKKNCQELLSRKNGNPTQTQVTDLPSEISFNNLIPKTEHVFPPKTHEFLDTQQVYTYGVVTETGPEKAYWDKCYTSGKRKSSSTDTPQGKSKTARTSSSTAGVLKNKKTGSTVRRDFREGEEEDNAIPHGRNMLQTQLVETDNYKLESVRASMVNKAEYAKFIETKEGRTKPINKVHKRLLEPGACQLLFKENFPTVLITQNEKDNQFSNNPYIKLQKNRNCATLQTQQKTWRQEEMVSLHLSDLAFGFQGQTYGTQKTSKGLTVQLLAIAWHH